MGLFTKQVDSYQAYNPLDEYLVVEDIALPAVVESAPQPVVRSEQPVIPKAAKPVFITDVIAPWEVQLNEDNRPTPSAKSSQTSPSPATGLSGRFFDVAPSY